jgi:hypothetical protein
VRPTAAWSDGIRRAAPTCRSLPQSALEFTMAKSNKKGGTSGSSQTGKSKRKGK